MLTIMKKVLITGANGFLGSNLARELFRSGYDIRVFVRPEADLSTITDIPFELCYGHIHDAEDVLEAVSGCDIVVHAAAVTDQWGIGFEQYEKINVEGTKNIADAVLQCGVEKLIFVSTANTIEPGSKDKPGTELNGFTLFAANSGYITTKYLAQQYILEQVEQNKLPAVVVNPTFMIGPNDSKPSSGKMLLYGVQNRLLLYPPGGKNFVYVMDVCKAIARAISHGKIGDTYLLAGHNLSYGEFFELLNRLSGKKRIMVRTPVLFLKIGGVLGSCLQKITGIRVPLNASNAFLLCVHNYYSGKKSERELGVVYTPMEEAIKKALTWFKEHNYY
jgi:dihydroflavonol-4-reductase